MADGEPLFGPNGEPLFGPGGEPALDPSCCCGGEAFSCYNPDLTTDDFASLTAYLTIPAMESNGAFSCTDPAYCPPISGTYALEYFGNLEVFSPSYCNHYFWLYDLDDAICRDGVLRARFLTAIFTCCPDTLINPVGMDIMIRAADLEAEDLLIGDFVNTYYDTFGGQPRSFAGKTHSSYSGREFTTGVPIPITPSGLSTNAFTGSMPCKLPGSPGDIVGSITFDV